jgi:hypothetical protein
MSGLVIDPEKPPARRHTYYACLRCGSIVDEYDAFGGGSLDDPRYYCRRHIPRCSRLRLWWQERRRP